MGLHLDSLCELPNNFISTIWKLTLMLLFVFMRLLRNASDNSGLKFSQPAETKALTASERPPQIGHIQGYHGFVPHRSVIWSWSLSISLLVEFAILSVSYFQKYRTFLSPSCRKRLVFPLAVRLFPTWPDKVMKYFFLLGTIRFSASVEVCSCEHTYINWYFFRNIDLVQRWIQIKIIKYSIEKR